MKRTHRLFLILIGFILLAVGLAFTVTAASDPSVIASGFCGGDPSSAYDEASEAYQNLTWSLYDNGKLVIEGTGPMKDYICYANSVSDYTHTNTPWCSYLDSLRSLVIGDGVTTIGTEAFAGRSGFTGSLVIPDSVTTIGNYAFTGCSGFNGSLVIGNGVRRIGPEAFCFCDGFTGTLTVPDRVTEIGDRAFFNCSGFTGAVIGRNVESIGHLAFCYCPGFSSVYFKGDPPTVIPLSQGQPSFDPTVTLQHLPSRTAWTESGDYDADTAAWNGYRLVIAGRHLPPPSRFPFLLPLLSRAAAAE